MKTKAGIVFTARPFIYPLMVIFPFVVYKVQRLEIAIKHEDYMKILYEKGTVVGARNEFHHITAIL